MFGHGELKGVDEAREEHISGLKSKSVGVWIVLMQPLPQCGDGFLHQQRSLLSHGIFGTKLQRFPANDVLDDKTVGFGGKKRCQSLCSISELPTKTGRDVFGNRTSVDCNLLEGVAQIHQFSDLVESIVMQSNMASALSLLFDHLQHSLSGRHRGSGGGILGLSSRNFLRTHTSRLQEDNCVLHTLEFRLNLRDLLSEELLHHSLRGGDAIISFILRSLTNSAKVRGEEINCSKHSPG